MSPASSEWHHADADFCPRSPVDSVRLRGLSLGRQSSAVDLGAARLGWAWRASDLSLPSMRMLEEVRKQLAGPPCCAMGRFQPSRSMPISHPYRRLWAIRPFAPSAGARDGPSTRSANEQRAARAARKAGTLAAMTILCYALAAAAGPTPHAAVMAVAVPSAMDRRDCPL